jgi:polynucleotide 5'-hydroxyl-kinase GRC3/NOL9
MPEDWANRVAQDFQRQGLLDRGACLILGGADTGKTTLALGLAARIAQSRPVAIVDADIGQSHIGPPSTVGWAVVDNPNFDLSAIEPGGIAFVGDITPVGHLLQFTAALTRCVEQAAELAEVILIDTPGFIAGPPANALWWTVQHALKPDVIIAVQRANELCDILAGLKFCGSRVEPVESPASISAKSPQQRRRHRQRQFGIYFRDSACYNLNLADVSVQGTRDVLPQNLPGRLVGLRNHKGEDVAVGVICKWQAPRTPCGDADGLVVVKAPRLDTGQIRCLVVGDAQADFGEG